MDLTLYYMPFSPWSHKARCALAHHALTPKPHIYAPLFGEPALRLKLRKLRGRVTVPVLFTPEGPLADSWEIALYADRVGTGTPLIPRAQHDEVARWNAASERMLSAGRSSAMLRVLVTPAAALETVPPFARRVMAGRGAQLGVRAFNAKYGIRSSELPRYEAAAREELERLAHTLSDGRRYLLGELSYADFAMAVGLSWLRPLPSDGLGPEMRKAMVDEGLAAQYPQLIAWRDTIHSEQPW
jgi:glutathione S-transferase